MDARRPSALAPLAEYRARLAMLLRVRDGPAAGRAPFVRSVASADGLLCAFVLASLPAFLIGVWNLGQQVSQALAQTPGATLSGWQGVVYRALQSLGGEPAVAAADGAAATGAGPLECMVLGLALSLPLLLVVATVTLLWELLFAARRGGAIDPAWPMTAWLFVLLLPPATSLPLAVLGASFGVLFGAHIFGGSGRYVVSPALLGILFLRLAYPEVFQAGLPVVGPEALPVAGLAGGTTWSAVAADGTGATAGLLATVLGSERGLLGTGSALACLAGGAWLVAKGAASVRTLVGALVGLVLGASLAQLGAPDDPVRGLAWYWHLALGNFAFAVAFLATDPSTSALTRPARWLHGLLIGLLTVMLRVVDPSHPEGALQAVLLAGLTVPVLDFLVLRRHRRRVPAWGAA
ncbi:MAG TPA: RnfABCDGE type electron transport complex subunit D [Pseudomonadales bacterium]|nr:RnfABCDGE type electron transport complex subunit D [Pseudomonadales bacterium]